MCGRVASCVDALCAADVPTTLVWLGRVHVDDPAFAPLARGSHRVVLDASQRIAGEPGARRATGRARAPPAERPGVAELAWTRLGPWQELCARMFDDARAARPGDRTSRGCASCRRPRRARRSAPRGRSCSDGSATRLGWKASSLAGKLRLLRTDGGHIQVQLEADAASPAPRGALLAVAIDAKRDGAGLRGEVARSPGEDRSGTWRVELQARGETQRVEQRVRTFASEPARTLERTLRRPVRDDALVESALWADELGSDELVCGQACQD